MEIEEQRIRKALEVVANGGSWDYAPVSGGLVVFNTDGERVKEGVDITTFLALREKSYIAMSDRETLVNWHPIFRPSLGNPVNIYRITEKGKEFLRN